MQSFRNELEDINNPVVEKDICSAQVFQASLFIILHKSEQLGKKLLTVSPYIGEATLRDVITDGLPVFSIQSQGFKE